MKWYCSSMLLRGPVLDAVEAIAAAGFDGVEVWADQVADNGETPAKILGAARSAGVGLTVHASSYDINLAAWNRGIRAESRRQIEASVQLAADLEAPIVVVHPGRRSSGQDTIEDYWSIVLESLEPIDALAEQLGVTLAVELMELRPKEVVMLPADATRILSHGFRATGLTVDLAHAYTHGDPVAFLDAIDMDDIAHVHLSDSDPDTVHLPLGEGALPLNAVVTRLVERGYDRIVNIEGYRPGRGVDLIETNARVVRELDASLAGGAHHSS